jgi:3-hydroxybutyryl-CoA dehydrogenase
MVELGALDAAGVSRTISNIDFTSDLDESLPGNGYVLEAVSENFKLMREVWKTLGQKADPDAILASNTPSYDINELGEGVAHPERVVGTHCFHPPQITPCVEVTPSRHTEPAYNA